MITNAQHTLKDNQQNKFNTIFKYVDGVLIRKCSRGNTKANSECRTLSSSGYYRVLVDEKRYFVHQVIFCMLKGYIPKCIDHIDGNKLNNRIENLRDISFQENTANRCYHNITNKLGVLGVHKLPSGMYRAQRMVKGVKYFSKPLPTVEEASKAYKELKSIYG